VPGSIAEDNSGDNHQDGLSLQSPSSDEENTSTCVICLDAFRVGDDVTWSKDMQCRHVFHQECLSEWLSNPEHDDCPFCRRTILSMDDDPTTDTTNEEASAAIPNLAFVIMNGLISPLRRASYSLVGSSISYGDCDYDSDGDNDVNHDNDDDEEQGVSRLDLSLPARLRRVASTGAAIEERRNSSSRLGVALRRASSGICSQLSSTFDSVDDALQTPSVSFQDPRQLPPPPPALKEPFGLRRCRSEGNPGMRGSGSGRRNRPQRLMIVPSKTQQENAKKVETDETKDALSPPQQQHERPGLFRRVGFRRSSSFGGVYARLSLSTSSSSDDHQEEGQSKVRVQTQMIFRRSSSFGGPRSSSSSTFDIIPARACEYNYVDDEESDEELLEPKSLFQDEYDDDEEDSLEVNDVELGVILRHPKTS